MGLILDSFDMLHIPIEHGTMEEKMNKENGSTRPIIK